MNNVYKRVVIKISGEALQEEGKSGINEAVVNALVRQIKEVSSNGVQMGIIVGGGNFWRGRQSVGMDQTTADHMGMLATMINALALTSALNANGVKAKTMSMIEVGAIAKRYSLEDAERCLEGGSVLVFGGGTGNPYFTTDTAAALKAAELHADILLLGKNVDGVYDSDPKQNKNAKKFSVLSYMDVIEKNLKVMDLTAASICMDNGIEIRVFAAKDRDGIVCAFRDPHKGTVIKR